MRTNTCPPAHTPPFPAPSAPAPFRPPLTTDTHMYPQEMARAYALAESLETENTGRPSGMAYQNAAPSDPSQNAQDAMNRAFENGQQLQHDLVTRVDSMASHGE